MGSLEDLRDFYKSSTKSKHLEIKSNGSTYSNTYKNDIYKRGNLVMKQVLGKKQDMNVIDEKYGINSTFLNYSLNKKGRWNMSAELKQNMPNFANDDLDVRLYETRDRIRSSYDNCISFSSSKGNNLKVNSTYANKESIKQNLKVEFERARNPEVSNNTQKTKNKSRTKHCSKKPSNPEHIIIDLNDNGNDDAEEYTEYEIQLPPTREVLKYNTLFETKHKDRVSSRITKNILGDELIKGNHSLSDYEYPNDFEEFAEEYEESEYKIPEKIIRVSLYDLINLYTKPIVEKRSIDSYKNKAKSNNDDLKEFRNLIFISRQNSKVDNKRVEIEPEFIKHPEAICLKVQIDENSLKMEILKEEFGLKYYEAFNAWPRMISINMNEDLIKEMTDYHKTNFEIYDVKAWLIIKDAAELNSSNQVIRSYHLTIKANFLIEEEFENFQSSETYEFKNIYEKIIKLITKTSLNSLKHKTKVTKAGSLNENLFLVNDLPTIGATSICKEEEDLKFELLNTTNENKDDNSSSLELKNDKIQQKLDKLFEKKETSCCLCFEENLTINKCTILLNCAHSVCNSCWKHYTDALVSNSFLNSGKLLCPVCDSELDIALILNFVSDINKFEQYLTAYIGQILAVMCEYKWCQSPSCNKAIKIDLASTPYGILSCECGHKTCLKCNMEPHFPAKCSQVAKYYSELKAKNHYLIPKNEIYKSTGKKVFKNFFFFPQSLIFSIKCPTCHVYMEKNGGCNQMVILKNNFTCNTQT